MERYVEMGFERASAAEAAERFGDDLHAGCHWLMVRQTMGHVPKRLKVSQAADTYIGSSVRFQGATWAVDGFDPDHALIRIRGEAASPCRWEHMSDQRLEWLTIRHESVSSTVPRAAWTRAVGQVQVSTRFLNHVEHRPGVGNMLSAYIRWGRPPTESPEWEIWRAIVSLTREHVHRPSRPRPRGAFTSDVHDFRVEWMTYFHALCDVHQVSLDHFGNVLYNGTVADTAALFPAEVRPALMQKLQMWKSPSEHIQQELKQWRKDCLPLVIFQPVRLSSDTLYIDVLIHDMTFVKPRQGEGGLHLQLQRLLFILFPKTRPRAISGPVEQAFFNSILRASKKSSKPAAAGAAFVSELFPFQKRCLSWMLERETTAPSTSAWGWSQNTLADGFTFYASCFGYMSLTQPNTTVRGGLLAQDVGMGKTVEMLALMATHKAEGPTLVVVPTTMLSVWMDEAAKHVPSLKTHKFHGARRTRDMDELRACDIVVTTYRIVVNETQQHVPTIGAIRWGRIVLDESHEMRNTHSATTKAVCRLYAPLRWCVSATPWPKGPQNVTSMLAYLGISPFNDLTQPTLPMPPHYRAHQCATPALLHTLLTSCTWWQQKRHVRLTLPDIHTQAVELDHSSPDVYQQLVASVRHRMEMDMSTPGINPMTRRLHYMRWLRQAATHPLLNRVSHYGFPCAQAHIQTETNSIDTFMNTLGTTNYDQSLRDLIQSWADGHEKCAICMDAMDRPTVTPCRHMFCFECIQSAYHHDPSRKCPLCRTPAGNEVLHELTVDEPVGQQAAHVWYTTEANGNTVEMDTATHQQLQALESSSGHKIDYVVEKIRHTDEKIVVFTQFHRAWDMLCRALQANNIRYVSIEGRMTPKRREKSIRDFQTDAAVRVFVMTTKTAAVGITLTASAHVLFMEPCHDVHVRKQAIGRVWRIGQTRPVTVTTLKTRQTIDCVTDFDSHVNPTVSV